MSTGKTTYLGLHRWEPDDDFLRTEFNENSDKLDEELEMMQKEMNSEFSAVQGEVSAVRGEVSAVQSELFTVQGAVSAVQGELSTVQGEVSTVRSELTAGLNGKAASSHGHTAGEISGVLPVGNGGTGMANLADLVPALGVRKEINGSYTGNGVSGRQIYLGSGNVIAIKASNRIDWGLCCRNTYTMTTNGTPFAYNGTAATFHNGYLTLVNQNCDVNAVNTTYEYWVLA